MTETSSNPGDRSQSGVTLDSKIDLLIEQVGRLTETLTTGLNDLNTTIDRQVQVAERQAVTVERLALTTERQSIMLERLLSQREEGRSP